MSQLEKPIVTIEGLSHEGRGIARLEGKTIFVDGVLVGEEVEITYLKRKNRFDEAKILSLKKPSEDRQNPQCSSFEICGGCSLQHMGTESQITYKQQVLLEQLKHIGNVQPKSLLPAVTASSYGYRRKARLGVRYVNKKEKLLIGFREKNGRYLADIDNCSVLHPSVGEKFSPLRDFLLSLENYLHIPQLEIAVGDNATAIIIRHLAALSEKDIGIIKKFAKETGFHLYLQPGGTETVHLLYPDSPPRLSYRLADFGIEMLFHPTDFTQVNAEINNKLITLALGLLQTNADDIVLDLFCGIGNFTLPLARSCQKVIGIEGSQLMVERGYENAAHNNISNVVFACRNLALNDYNTIWEEDNISAVLLDPPRAGALEVVKKIPLTAAKKIVYVSCNPATLARDVGYLCQHGFELTAVGVLDMFPHTSHVESIALLNR